MLKVKFMQIENVVVMKVLEQSKKVTEFLDATNFYAQNGMVLKSCEEPEISDAWNIYLRGKNTNKDTLYNSYSFNSIDEADEFIDNAREAINEFNKKYNFPNEETEEIKTIIAR